MTFFRLSLGISPGYKDKSRENLEFPGKVLWITPDDEEESEEIREKLLKIIDIFLFYLGISHGYKGESRENLEVQGKVLWNTRDDQEKRAEIIMGIYWTLDTHWEMIANG